MAGGGRNAATASARCADEALEKFKGSIPLTLVKKVTLDGGILRLHIPGRVPFELRKPSSAPTDLARIKVNAFFEKSCTTSWS